MSLARISVRSARWRYGPGRRPAGWQACLGHGQPGEGCVEAYDCLEGAIVEAGSGPDLGQVEGGSPVAGLVACKVYFEARPPARWRRIEEVCSCTPECVGEPGQHTQLGFDAAVLDLGEIRGGAADQVTQPGKGEPGRSPLVA